MNIRFKSILSAAVILHGMVNLRVEDKKKIRADKRKCLTSL